jgi:AAA domain
MGSRCAPLVAWVTAEDRRELLIARLVRIMEAMDLSAEDRATVCVQVMIWDVTGAVCRLTELDRHSNVVLTGLADAIVERFREASPVVVGLDPVISFGAGERFVNDNEHSLILAARRIVRGLGCCVRLICHTGKQGFLGNRGISPSGAQSRPAMPRAVRATGLGAERLPAAAGATSKPWRPGARVTPWTARYAAKFLSYSARPRRRGWRQSPRLHHARLRAWPSYGGRA